MVNALGYDFVGLSARAWPPRTRSEHDQRFGHNLVIFQPMLGRRNIRPPHFASKVSYSASPQTLAECSRSAPCSDATFAMLIGSKSMVFKFS